MKVDWRYADDSSGASAWKSFDEVKPNLSGNRIIHIRKSATGTNLPINFAHFQFTDNKYEPNETYIKVKNLSIIKVKNLSIVDSTPSAKNAPAENMIDGNFGLWTTQNRNFNYSR